MSFNLRRTCCFTSSQSVLPEAGPSSASPVTPMISTPFKNPALLSLRLSGSSFLDTVITDRSGPLYTIETNASSTSLFRCGPNEGQGEFAAIGWPAQLAAKGKQRSPTVSIGGWIGPADDFLLPHGKLSSSRKFFIPGHKDPLKWKPVDAHYECRIASKPSTLVATFEPAILTSAARLLIYVPSLVMDDAYPQRVFGFVSSHLLDYVILSALLLVTRPDEWTTLFEISTAHTAPSPTDIDSPYSNEPPSPVHSSPTNTTAPPSVINSPMSTIPTPFILPPPPSPIRNSLTIPTPYILPPRSASLPLSHAPRHPYSEREETHNSQDDSAFFNSKKEKEHLEPPPPYEEIEWTARIGGRGRRRL